MYKAIIKHLFFLFPAERAHYLATDLLHLVLKLPGLKSVYKSIYCVQDEKLEREVFGIRFPNPVGLAAGFDKNASMYRDLRFLGFGFIEIGTVTPLPQDGNPKPRLFRLKKDQALINRMGFNNLGLKAAINQLKNRPENLIIGGNIGKNKATPNGEAVSDYVKCFEGLFPYVDYFVVNVSSPNTPNLRELQDKEPLEKLLNELMRKNHQHDVQKPILLKIAPDLSYHQLDEIIEIVEATKIDGLIATNTTISRENLQTPYEEIHEIGAGGLSGKPLKERSTEVIQYIVKKSAGRIPVIGVGGILTPSDAKEKLDAGASLVQVYSGFIYEGPSMVSNINNYLLRS